MGRVLHVAVEALVGVAQGGIGALALRAAEEQALAVLGTGLGGNGDALLRAGLDVGSHGDAQAPLVSARTEAGSSSQRANGQELAVGTDEPHTTVFIGLGPATSEVVPSFFEATTTTDEGCLLWFRAQNPPPVWTHFGCQYDEYRTSKKRTSSVRDQLTTRPPLTPMV